MRERDILKFIKNTPTTVVYEWYKICCLYCYSKLCIALAASRTFLGRFPITHFT